jgi:hypothetical protein
VATPLLSEFFQVGSAVGMSLGSTVGATVGLAVTDSTTSNWRGDGLVGS